MKKIIKSHLVLLLGIFSLLIAGCEEEKEKIEPGMQALESRNYDKAVEIFKACVDREGEKGKSASNCLFLLGKAYYEKKQYKEAINYFHRAINIHKEGMDAMLGRAWHFWLGKAYYENEQYKEAAQNFAKAASTADENPQQEFDKHFRGHDYPMVKFWRRYYVPLFPPKSSCYFWLGNAYYWDRQHEQAINAFQEAIKLNPKDAPDYYTMLAATYRETKQYDKAIAAANRAIEIRPSDFPYGVLRSIYEKQGKLDQAISSGKKAIELNPKNVSLYLSLSNLYLKIEDYPSNLAILQKAQELVPDNYHIYYAIGDTYARLGKFDDAMASLNKAIMLLSSPSLLTGFGLIAIQGNYPVVVGTVQGVDLKVGDRIIKINGESTKGSDLNKIDQILQAAKENQVFITMERKGADKALEKKFNIKKEEIKKVEILNRNSAGPLGKRSLVYAIKGDWEKGQKDAHLAYSLDPHNTLAKEAISFSYIIDNPPLTRGGKIEEATRMLANIKDDQFARLLEALAHSKMGDFKKSAEVYISIPEEFLLAKDVFRQHFKEAVLESLAPYVTRKKESAKALEARGQNREALKEYADLLKIADQKAAQEIRSYVAVLLNKNPHLKELPEEARKHALRAEVLVKEGNFAEAVKEYKEGIRIAPFFPVLYKAIALSYAELKEYQKATDNMNIYLELFPDAPDVRAAKDEIYKWEFWRDKGNK